MWEGKSTSSHRDVEDNADETSSRLARVMDDDDKEEDERRKNEQEGGKRRRKSERVRHGCRFVPRLSKERLLKTFIKKRRTQTERMKKRLSVRNEKQREEEKENEREKEK